MTDKEWEELADGCPGRLVAHGMARCAMTTGKCEFGLCAVWFMALSLFNRLIGAERSPEGRANER